MIGLSPKKGSTRRRAPARSCRASETFRMRRSLERAIEHDQKRRQLHGLGQELLGAFLDRLDRQVDGAVAGQQQHRQRRVLRLEGAQHVEAVAVRQREVDHRGVDGLPAQQLADRGDAVGLDVRVALAVEEAPAAASRTLSLVVHQQDLPLSHAGSLPHSAPAAARHVKRAPPVSRFSAVTRPPCASTTRCTIDSPRPVPPLRRVKKGSKSAPGRSAARPGAVVLHGAADARLRRRARRARRSRAPPSPRGACWIALAIRFSSACSMRAPSTSRRGSSASDPLRDRDRALACRAQRRRARRARTTSARSRRRAPQGGRPAVVEQVAHELGEAPDLRAQQPGVLERTRAARPIVASIASSVAEMLKSGLRTSCATPATSEPIASIVRALAQLLLHVRERRDVAEGEDAPGRLALAAEPRAAET